MQAHAQQPHSPPGPHARRSVSRETLEFADGSCECVIKSFHHPGAVGRLLDGRRARREFNLLRRLEAAGLRVPRAIAIRRGPRGPQLVTQVVPSAKSLEHWLSGSEDWPTGAKQCAGALGALMARAHAIGLDHGDIYPSNVLLDAEGQAWIVDLGSAKIGPPRLREQDLIAAAASVREQTSARFRARFLRSYLRNLPADLLAPKLQLGPWSLELEARARLRRRSVVERHLGRWLRESGVCASGTNPRRISSRAATRAELEACEKLAEGTSAAHSHPPGSTLVTGDVETVKAAWLTAARAKEHNLAAARPLLLNPGPNAWAVFAQPPSCAELFAKANPLPAATQARALGHLFGLLSHRGLGLKAASAANFKMDAAGAVYLQPGAQLEARDTSDPASERRICEALFPGLAEWSLEFDCGRRAGEQNRAAPVLKDQGARSQAQPQRHG